MDRWVLLVSDDEEQRTRIAGVLRAGGHCVTEEKRGLDGLARVSGMLAANRMFDLVITDLVSPGRSSVRGFSLIAFIRSIGCRCPAVFITKADGNEVRERARELDATLVLRPVDARALRDLVDSLLDRPASRRAG